MTYDKARLQASIHTEPLPIPPSSVSIGLRVQPGVTAARGGNEFAQEMQRAVAIPGLYSLDIAELKQIIVTGDSDLLQWLDGNQQQVWSVQLPIGATLGPQPISSSLATLLVMQPSA